MRIGFTLPQFGTAASRPAELVEFAATAEKLGADSLWVADRLLAPEDPVLGYGQRGPGPYPAEFHSVFDPFTALTVAATATSRVRLGTHVLITPFYAALPLARQLASIDVLSGGRVVPGLGVGWAPEEYAAVGIPMNERGARLEETLDVLHAAWTEPTVRHEGRRWSIAPSSVDLKPVGPLPVHLGGFAPAALRRVGRRAAGWLPATTVPGKLRAADYAGPLATIREAASAAGRDREEIEVVLRLNAHKGVKSEDLVEAVRTVRDEGFAQEVVVELLYAAPELSAAVDLAGRLLTA